MGSTLFVETDPQVQAWLDRRRELGQDGRDEVWDGVCHVAPHEHGRNGMVAMQLVLALGAAARSAGLTPGGSFTLGSPGDFRVPDLGFHRDPASLLYYPTAALVIEVLSPRDETFAKSGFYAAHGVEELWVVDPLQRSVRIWRRSDPGGSGDGGFPETGRSDLLGRAADQVERSVRWPWAGAGSRSTRPRTGGTRAHRRPVRLTWARPARASSGAVDLSVPGRRPVLGWCSRSGAAAAPRSGGGPCPSSTCPSR